MSWIMAGMASASATMAGVQYVKGRQDAKKAARDRPVAEIPDYAYQNLDQAQVMALEGMSAQDQNVWTNNIKQTSADALSNIGSRKGGLIGVDSVYANENNSLGKLTSTSAGMRRENLLGLRDERNKLADYTQQAYNENERNPYYQKLAQDQARVGALFQNFNQSAGIGAGMNFKKNKPTNFDGIKTPSAEDQWQNEYNNQNYDSTY